jgi:hypothetical protein
MDESKITYDRNGNALSFSGPDAVKLFQAAALRSGLGLMAVGIKPHRSWTSLRAALETASSYTGKKYAGKKDIERARADLLTWCETMKAALPSETLA